MDHDAMRLAAHLQAPPQRRHTDRRHSASAANQAPLDHFPTLLIDTWHLRDGTRITQRPVLPQDGPLLGALMQRLSALAKRQRFHGSVNALTPAWLDRLSHVDYQQHLALVMTRQDQKQGEQIIAEARYVIDPTGNSAEFALLVDESWQRCGLGARAMQVLEVAATRAGLRWLHGEMLASNLPMLALMQARGFSCTPDRHNAALVQAEMLLCKPAPQPGLGLRAQRWMRRLLAPHTVDAVLGTHLEGRAS